MDGEELEGFAVAGFDENMGFGFVEERVGGNDDTSSGV